MLYDIANGEETRVEETDVDVSEPTAAGGSTRSQNVYMTADPINRTNSEHVYNQLNTKKPGKGSHTYSNWPLRNSRADDRVTYVNQRRAAENDQSSHVYVNGNIA